MQTYPTQAPVISHSDPAFDANDVIGHAKTEAEATDILKAYFADTGATLATVEQRQPEQRGKGPVDAWVPVLDA